MSSPGIMRALAPLVERSLRGCARLRCSSWCVSVVIGCSFLSPPILARGTELAPVKERTILQVNFVEEASVNWVLVPVVVRNRDGYLVDLRSKDFAVSVDGIEVFPASIDRTRDAPISMILLQDLSGSMGNSGRLDSSRRALSCFLDELLPGDELALASFSSGLTRIDVPFGEPPDQIREAMASWRPYGSSMIYDAVSWLPDLSRRSVSTTVLLVTDGADNASVIDPKTSGNIARRAAVPVYVLSLEPRRDRSTTSFSLDRHLLAALARATGGRLYEIHGNEDLDRMCSDLLGRMRSQYLLGIETAGEGPIGDHTIRVVLRKKKLEIWYRQGYRGFRPLQPDDEGRQK